MQMQNTDTTLIEFPCSFPIKTIGINSDTFIAEIIAIVSSKCNDFNPDNDVTINRSTQDKYIAITTNVNATSKTHLDSIYLQLKQHESVKFIL